jgi:hypothetical protein
LRSPNPQSLLGYVEEAELVAVNVLIFHGYEEVQGDQVWFVVDIEDTGLDILNVAAAVVDVLGRRLVTDAFHVISLIPMEIRKMSKAM